MTYCCFSYCHQAHCSRAPARSAAGSSRATAGKLEHTFHVFLSQNILYIFANIYPRRRVLRSCVVLVRQFNQMFNLFLPHEVDARLDSGSLCVCLFVRCMLNANISNGCCKLWKLIYVHIVLLCVTYEGAHRNDGKIIYIFAFRYTGGCVPLVLPKMMMTKIPKRN